MNEFDDLYFMDFCGKPTTQYFEFKKWCAETLGFKKSSDHSIEHVDFDYAKKFYCPPDDRKNYVENTKEFMKNADWFSTRLMTMAGGTMCFPRGPVGIMPHDNCVFIKRHLIDVSMSHLTFLKMKYGMTLQKSFIGDNNKIFYADTNFTLRPNDYFKQWMDEHTNQSWTFRRGPAETIVNVNALFEYDLEFYRRFGYDDKS